MVYLILSDRGIPQDGEALSVLERPQRCGWLDSEGHPAEGMVGAEAFSHTQKQEVTNGKRGQKSTFIKLYTSCVSG